MLCPARGSCATSLHTGVRLAGEGEEREEAAGMEEAHPIAAQVVLVASSVVAAVRTTQVPPAMRTGWAAHPQALRALGTPPHSGATVEAWPQPWGTPVKQVTLVGAHREAA